MNLTKFGPDLGDSRHVQLANFDIEECNFQIKNAQFLHPEAKNHEKRPEIVNRAIRVIDLFVYFFHWFTFLLVVLSLLNFKKPSRCK